MSIEVLVAVAGLAIMAFDIGSLLAGKEPPKDPFAQTTVTIITGLAQHAAGDTPLVHVKSHYGDHLCAMNDYKADIGSSQARTYYMENEYGKMDQPAYVLLKMRAEQNNDICLSGLMLSGNGATYAWTGDLGWKCGANASSLSLHMPDFLGEPGLQRQYEENYDRLCRNEARMTFWTGIMRKEIKWFVPRLEYTEDGGLKDPDHGIDRATDGYPDGTYFPWITNGKTKRHPRDFKEGELPKSNNKPDVLTISHLPGHSARELCESITSHGPDFLVDNGEEKLFCDMTRKELFEVCDEHIIIHCFDMETKLMKNVGQRLKHKKRDLSYGDVVPMKQYNITDEWHPKFV